MRVLLDTSVLIPAIVPALPQHETALPHLESTVRGKESLVLSAHSLAECYASLTALPVSPRVTPGQARSLITENIVEAAQEIVELDSADYLNVLQRMTDLGLESGAVYEALHVRCAEKASVDELRTFNGEDFRRLSPEAPIELVVL